MSNKKIIRVILADDHTVYTDGVELLISKHPDIRVIASVTNGKQLMEQATKLKPDIVVTDIRMPLMDGVTAIRLLSALPNPVKVIAVSAYDDHTIAEAIEAGAKGYILKNAERGEIVDAIRTVYAEKPFYSLATSYAFNMNVDKSRYSPSHIAAANLFTMREKEIVRLICLGKSNQEIADTFFMAVRTVEGVRKRIMEKMGVNNVVGLVLYAIRNGLFKP